MTQYISALFDTHDEAAQTVRRLKESGFSDRDLTVLAKTDERVEAHEGDEHASEEQAGHGGAWAGSALGAAVAGSAGLLSMALIPAVPLLMVGGAAAVGGLGDATARFSSGPMMSEQTQRILRAGGALVVLETDADDRARLARDILTAGSRFQVTTAEA